MKGKILSTAVAVFRDERVNIKTGCSHTHTQTHTHTDLTSVFL